MNRLISIALACLLNISLAVASTYNLRVEVTPNGAGSLNTNGGSYEENSSIYLRTYGNTGYVFKGWYEGETQLSSSTSFNYTMPSRDALVQARYEFDPASPSDPDVMNTQYTVTLFCKPIGGGSFNTSSATAEEGSSVHLYAYPNTGYKFIRWENETGETVSTGQNFYYVIPHGDSNLYGIFEFDPEVPENPNKNYWNKELGEVIVDDFKPGYLSNAISEVIKGSSSNDVTMITVAGVINSYDFGIANNYSNCTLLDLSRVTGVSEVPSYAFDYTNLESVYLPATIEKIGYRAFYECKQLSSLTIYAMTPPTLESNVFKNVPEGLVVYVPAAAIAQYQDAEGWKDFTLLPIQEDIRNITVSLPEGAKPADYAQMWLELTNTKNGQRIHYVMTDRTTYTFMNIIRNTSWNVTLRNERGDVFGQIENVEVKDEDVSVVFSKLSKPQSVALTVQTPNGQDVTDQTQITWTDNEGNYVAQGTSLTGLPIGYQANYRVALSQELAMQYDVPQAAEYVLKDGRNNIVCQLKPIKQIKISGKVREAETNLPLSGAIISASQTFAGKYSKTLNAKTDNKGEFILEVANVPTSVAFSATDYISQSLVCDSLLNDEATVVLPDIALKPISGAVISLDLKYKTCIADGEEAETQNWYSDYHNVSYSVYNVTKKHTISQFNEQYPQIVLLEDVDDGDVLRLTASSRTNSFMPVETTATIVEQKATAVFDIKELGKIQSSFVKTDNASVVGSLYDASGKLVKTYDYLNASLTINNLTDGRYTLVSMGSSPLFNTVYDLSQLPQVGLTKGTDYVQNQVDVKSGMISSITIAEVPKLDESKLYYTGNNTSFTVNKPSIVVGNYLTLTGHIDFKSAYASEVSNVQMIVDLPESCEFVENSVMVGNSTSSYILNGHQIAIPMARYTDRVRFCVIPTLGGDYAPNAFVKFDLNGETITQPIGPANYTAKDLSIYVPSIVAKSTVPISGTAIGKSEIEIYDNGVVIGQTTSLANGTWATTCELNEPFNLSTHNIYVKVTTAGGIALVSETKSCLYDKNAIEVNTVTMINTAHTAANLDLYDYVTVFDFQNPKESYPAYWYWPSYPNFTFLVDFTKNDTTVIKDVTLYVFTDHDDIVTLYPTYDSKKDKFVATAKFDSYSLPYNVSVDFTADVKSFLDAQHIRDAGKEFEDISKEYLTAIEKLRSLFSAYDDSISDEQYKSICESMDIEYDDFSEFDDDEIDISNWTSDQIEAYLDSCMLTCSQELESYKQAIAGCDKWFELPHEFSETFGDGATYSISDCKGITRQQLEELGYDMIETTEGTIIYLLTTVKEVTMVSFEDDLRISIILPDNLSSEALERLRKAPLPEKFSEVYGWIKEARELVNTIYNDFLKRLMLPEQKLVDQIGSLQKYIAKCERYLKMCNVGSARWKYWNRIIKDAKSTLATTRVVLKCTKPLLRFLARCIPIADYMVTLNDCWSTATTLSNIYASIPDPCLNDQSKANWCMAEDIGILVVVGGMAIADVVSEITGDVEIAGGAAASIATGGTSLAVSGWGLVKKIAAQIGKCCINLLAQKVAIKHLEKKVSQLKCKESDPPTPPSPPSPPGGGAPNVKDPSGYVYEGISSNRIEGVTATAYYKEMVEDMYGDLHENIVKWDAAEYAQENPLFTDEYGMYAWDVPNGLWQVKFEKEGYETTYSEWLPVPPPQLDINIAMTQNRQPEVKTARAYEDAVEVEFDKYMMPEFLTTENISVMQAGKPVDGSIVLLNEEARYEGETETFASKVRFNASQPFTEQEITLLVNNRVKSYAGIRMQDNYQQEFSVEKEIKQILSDSLMVVEYGDIQSFIVSVLPASASAGKTLTVNSSSPLILEVETKEVTIDNTGKAEIIVSGELPGTAALTFSIEGTDKNAVTIVNVVQNAIKTVALPIASIASGSVVEKGTEISLSCSTKGSTIYYTLDGSCPCDDTPARKVYDGSPIIITQSVTIKAMATAPDMYDSEIAEFTYIVKDGEDIEELYLDPKVQIYPLPIKDVLNVKAGGHTIKYVSLTAINGVMSIMEKCDAQQAVLDVSSLPSGVYIINVATDDNVYSSIVVK